jgi:phenylacetate-CoA ligase
MNSRLQTLYEALPPFLRTAAASLHGYRLRHCRYGKVTDRLVSEALAKDHWSVEQWDRWQQEHLARMLHHAATEVPFYQDHWLQRAKRRHRSSIEDLGNWPIVHKQQIRKNPRAFLARGIKPSKLLGSIPAGPAAPALVVQPRTIRVMRMEARLRRWNGD